MRLAAHVSNRFIYFSAYLNLHPFPDILTDRNGQGGIGMETALIFVKDHMPMFRDSDAWGRSLKYRQVASAMRTEDRKDASFI